MITRKKNLLCFSFIILMAFSFIFSVPIYASENNPIITRESLDDNAKAGTEVLPLGDYIIGSFTFTDTNLTPVKTPAGRYIRLFMGFQKASIDSGLGNVSLTVNVRDARTGQIISKNYKADNPTPGIWSMLITDQIDLGYANRPIQIWFDATSMGQSNGNFRSITVDSLRSTVSNTKY